MNDDVILKIKDQESLEVLKLVFLIYLIFLFFFALVIRYQESVLQAFIILVFVFVVDAINSAEMIVTEKGITTRGTGFIKYSKMYRVELKKRMLYIYTRDREHPYKITFALSEDPKLVQNTYKSIDSKVKRIMEEEKDHQEYVEKYL